MKFIDLFSGIGGFRSALEKNGHECVGFAEIDKFAIQSYKALYDTEDEIELGDISKISDEDIAKLKNEVDVVVGGSPCFRAGTLISTRDGLKPIEEIKKGDEVLTHENRFRKVVMPMITHADSIYKLRTMNSVPTYVTEEHPFLVVERTKKWKNGKYFYEYSEPTWVKTKDLVKNKHFIKLGNSNNDIPSNITEEEAWLIGRYIADGYLMDSKRKGRKNSFRRDVVFCVGKTKAEEFENNLNEYSFGKSEDRTAYKYRKSNDRLFTLMEKCGRGSQNKEIPREYLDLPLNLLEKLVEGYLSGDGSYKDGVYSATTVSPKLALSLTEAFNTLHNNGTTITFSKRPDKYIIEGREVNQRDTYRVQTRFSYDKGATPHTVEINGELFTPIRELEKESTDELVYNFEVEEDNSYVANNLVAHNCQSFSIAGNRGGFDDTRGTLFFEYARTVKDIQPKYFIFENVKGMLSHDKGNTIRTVLNTFNDLGYYIDFNVFNSKFYDVPQNRERIYIVGKRKDLVSDPKFHESKKRKIKLDEVHNWAVENIQYVNLLPELKTVVNKRLVDILEEEEVDEKFFLDEEKTERLLERIKNREVKNNFGKQVADYRYDEGLRIREEGISPCLTANLKSMGTDNKDLSNAVYVVDNEITKADGLYCNDSEGFFRGTVEGVSRTLKENKHDAGVIINREEPKITVVGNTSNIGHRSQDVHDVKGIIPTIAARDYKGPKQIIIDDTQAFDGVGTYEEITPTLRANRYGLKDMEGDFDAKEIERNTLEILQTLQKEIGEKEIAKWRSRILDTFQQKEILRQDVHEKRLGIEQDEKKLERKEQSLECEVKNTTFDKQERMREMSINKEFRRSSHGRESIQQFARELTSIMQELSHETSQEKNLHRLRETAQGIRLLQQTLYKIQEIWRPSLYEEQSFRIRKLTEKECWRLQGFTDEQFYKAKNSGVSRSQLYKQAGNAVTVNVVDYIAKHLLVD